MRCPVCRAENDPAPQCRRCRADLTLLADLEEQRRQLLDTARRHLVGGDTAPALDAARQAHGLRADDTSRRLLAISHLLRRDFPRAWRYYLRSQESGVRSQSR